MANPKLVVVAVLLATASLGAVLLSSKSNDGDGTPWGGARSSSSVLTTLPFSPADVLPLLPRRVAMSALRALRGASDIFPVFVGAAVEAPDTASGAPVGWKGACFYKNEAWLEFNNRSGTAYGGGTVHIKGTRATTTSNAKVNSLWEQQTRNKQPCTPKISSSELPLSTLLRSQLHLKFSIHCAARYRPTLGRPLPAMGGSRSSLLLLLPLFVVALLFAASRGSLLEGPLRVPVLPGDLLPLLPWSVARPLLRRLALQSPADLLPAFVGAARVPGGDDTGAAEWKGACFYENKAWMEFHDNGTDGGLGGGTVHLETTKAHSWTCMDLYVFATPYRVTWDYYFLGREHTLEIKEWESKAEYEYVKRNGVSIFLMPSGTIGTLRALWDVFPLFTNTGWGENANLAFLKKHMGATFEERPKPWVSELNVDDIHSGDFLVLSKIRGRWGGFETLEKWVTGAYAGHTAVCLRDSEGKLWVGESGHENEQGEDIIAILPWDEWWDFEVTTDDSNPQIALLPLRPDLRAKFNETAAWNYAKQMNGKPYGYHNMIFSWIDTISNNYPPPLDAHVVASVMTVWNKLQPEYAANMWKEALNKRLGTKGLDLPDIIVESEKRGMTFDKLLTVPEKDDWVYTDGQSASCVAYVLMMYKEAGLFDPISSSIEVTEFTIKDAYVLNFFESNTTRLPAWCNKDDTVKLPFCQIKGRYRMELPGYNTMEPYPHMNERCASLPPDYVRSQNC